MPPLPLEVPPGIVKTKTPHAARGRYTDGDHVRFVGGHPEKWLGWRLLIDEQVEGIGGLSNSGDPRAAREVGERGHSGEYVDEALRDAVAEPMRSEHVVQIRGRQRVASISGRSRRSPGCRTARTTSAACG